jgi:hypothetical protein
MLATFAASKIHNFKHPGRIGIHSATLATSGGFGNSAKNSGIHHQATLATSGFGNSLCQELRNSPSNSDKWIC